MLEAFQGSQVILLSTVLIVAGLSKLVVREPESVPPSGHEVVGPRVLGSAHTGRPAVVGLALAEGVLGIGLLLTTHVSVRVATVIGMAGATWVVGELRTQRPDRGCGCFGALSTSRVGVRSLVRSALVTGSAIAALGFPHTGLDALGMSLGWIGVMLLGELVAFLVLSPEVGVLITRLRFQPPCELRAVPLSTTHHVLHASRPWRENRGLLTSRVPLDVWRESCWRLLVYPGRLDGREVEVVFAVSTGGHRPAVRSAVIGPDGTDEGRDSHDEGACESQATAAADAPQRRRHGIRSPLSLSRRF